MRGRILRDRFDPQLHDIQLVIPRPTPQESAHESRLERAYLARIREITVRLKEATVYSNGDVEVGTRPGKNGPVTFRQAASDYGPHHQNSLDLKADGSSLTLELSKVSTIDFRNRPKVVITMRDGTTMESELRMKSYYGILGRIDGSPSWIWVDFESIGLLTFDAH